MTISRINRLLLTIAVTISCGLVFNPVRAFAAPQFGCDRSNQSCTSCRQSGGCVNCPQCSEAFVPPPQEFCELKISEGKESRTCFEVDYKTICIPKVVPPWRQCCEPICAETRSVKILKTKKYECPKCKYEWSAVKPVYQQPAAAGDAAYFNQVPIQAPITRGNATLPGYGAPLTNPVPVVPGRMGVPVLPASSVNSRSFIVPSPTTTPPAPPAASSIGDYFGGR